MEWIILGYLVYFGGMFLTNYFLIGKDCFLATFLPNIVWFAFIPEVIKEIRARQIATITRYKVRKDQDEKKEQAINLQHNRKLLPINQLFKKWRVDRWEIFNNRNQRMSGTENFLSCFLKWNGDGKQSRFALAKKQLQWVTSCWGAKSSPAEATHSK